MTTRSLPMPQDITGLVLAGGRGTRLGGLDKGLQPWRGRALVDHVLDRLVPQVGHVIVNANRHGAEYASRGWPVRADLDTETYDGPLAGMLAGLRAAATPWVAVVPCDAPRLPTDLVARLATHAGPHGAVATHPGPDGAARIEPLFCLLPVQLAGSLADALVAGERKVDRWLGAAGVVPVAFDRPEDAGAFANLNRPEDLQA
jgi:molybdopterin-guanine dinucleotide biosynthesis protein A